MFVIACIVVSWLFMLFYPSGLDYAMGFIFVGFICGCLDENRRLIIKAMEKNNG